MSIVMRNAYARQIIRDSMDNLRRKMETERNEREGRHHSIPIGVWTVQKKAQIRDLLDMAGEIRRRTKYIKGAINLPYKDALYRTAIGIDATVYEIEKEIERANEKHARRAQKRETENEHQD